MKQLLILGAGTAGTTMLNKLHKTLDNAEWELTIVDKDERHFYQPGFLFIPFKIFPCERMVRPKRDFFPKGVRSIFAEADRIEPEENRVVMKDGTALPYDILIIATGTTPRPSETPGLDGELWQKDIHEFYTFEGACKLRDRLQSFEGGRLVINIAESLNKCPVAPLEFAFLADAYFKDIGIRDKVEIIYSTPMPGAFTKPIAASFLGEMLEEKGVEVVPDFYVERVDNEARQIVSYDGQTIDFDLLVSVPTNMGDDVIDRSNMGDADELNYVPTQKHTLQAQDYDNIFVIGDATNVPTSKAGSVAHFESETLEENIHHYIKGEPLAESFDGHANCFIETGDGKAALIDFNYDQEPLPRVFPYSGIGPFQLLKSTRMNHLGKLAFEWTYWNLLLKGVELPVPTRMSMSGKRIPE